MNNYTAPNWKPLEDLNKYYPNLFNMDDFMWMQTVDGIECYKHRLTRDYVNIDSTGNCWKYIDSKYTYISIMDAVKGLNKLNEFQQKFDARHGV